jgi:hypothetical protein
VGRRRRRTLYEAAARCELFSVRSGRLIESRRIRCCMYVNALFGWWRPGGSTCDSAPRSGRARADGGGGRVRHPATPLAARCGAGGGGAERVRAATEGTLRRDFAKGHFEGISLDFSKGLSKGLFAGSEHLVSGGFPNRFPSFQIGEGNLASKGLRFRGEHYERRLARARRRRRSWDDNNRFKPRTTVTHWTQSLTNTTVFFA